MPLKSSQNKCCLTVERETVTVDGLIVPLTLSLTREVIAVKMITHILLTMEMAANLSPLLSASLDNFMNVKSEGIDALAESIYNNGPHTVYVYANSNFQRYHSGIFDDSSCSTSSYNHAVINIGYDVNEGYWTIRNSWASSWGEQGHIRMARGKNTCNIEHYAWVPYL